MEFNKDVTVGYNTEGAHTLLDHIQEHVIDDTCRQMEENVSQLEEVVDRIWQGKSADIFKTNMEQDVRHIQEHMQKAKEALDVEIASIVNAMDKADEQLVQRRS